MKLVDANVLLYAVNSDTDKHTASAKWLNQALSGTEPVGFAWLALVAFIRLSTKVGIFASPLTVQQATSVLEAWLAQPNSLVLHPTPRHAALLAGLLAATGTGGNLANDAHLGTLAVEYDATVVTYDSDFGRFPGVRWATPESV